MNRFVKKIGILSAVFVAALAVYFIWDQKNTEKGDAMVYTSMDEASLPVVSMEMFGRSMNLLHGYTQDMKQSVARQALTVLPEDRALRLRIKDYGGGIEKISYEIRSLDLERLVERTEVADWQEEAEGITASLPIQNLLTRDKEYLLILSLDTPEKGRVNYYTRIIWTDSANAEAMVAFAEDFTTKTFDYNQARELTTYLETNHTEDNSSLGHVTIKSSFSQLTWGGLSVKPVGDIQVTLKDLDGIMCSVQLNYQVSRAGENGVPELYEAEDSFTMKWDARRIYLMDFERSTNQIFSGQRGLFSGRRILLGITNDDKVQALKSPSGSLVAYVVNRDLWTYDQRRKHAVKVFSFRSGEDDGLQSSYNQHDIKILSAGDNGDVNFLVYGYMNRGIHEGSSGIALYQYSSEDNAIKERFFTPVSLSFDLIKEDVDRLAHLGANGMLYMIADRAVYGIDLNSSEYMVLADSLVEGGFAVSSTEQHFAWQEGNGPYGAGVIHLMDLDTGEKREITGGEGNIYRPLGFVGDDFIYGIAREGDLWVQNGRVIDAPMYRIEIMDENGKIVKEYEQEGVYIAGVSVEDSRIHLTQAVKSGDQTYAASKEDTIVCNEEVLGEELEGIGWYASEDRRKLYFVQLSEEASGREVKVTVPKKVAYETTEVVELKNNVRTQENRFYAYGGGRCLGSSKSFAAALALAYEKMGVVTDRNQEIVWNRVNRPPVRNIKDPVNSAAPFFKHLEHFTGSGVYEEGVMLLDARGCMLNQVLYFIGQGCPAAAYTKQNGLIFITGYDQYNVTLLNPETGESQKMGLNDASAYFAGQGNDFVCGVIKE